MKRITARQLKRGQPEETLAPGEGLEVTKKNGKTFELRRTDKQKRSRYRGLLAILKEIPLSEPDEKVDLVADCKQLGL